ncbi:hypothetical protein ERJ75_000645100 [Trypanosoma vivax]|nr:hypothetical protein ERJ75_000645100 [Trypanosoma vivax]
MKSESRSQGEESGPLEPAGDGDGKAERARKRRRVGHQTEEKERGGYEFSRCGSTHGQWHSLVWRARPHHKNATSAKRKITVGTVATTPLVQRTLQCPCCPMKCALQQCLAMHRQAKHSQPRRQSKQNSLKVECQDSVAQLLRRPSLRELREKHELETLKDGELFSRAQLPSFLKELFKLESPNANTPDEQELRPARA